jgi:ABC-type Fe3+/spermidine/putrescine transport system ATPase subunit
LSLRVQGVRKLYPEFHLELDFEVRPGEMLTLLGPSGCGKTTTLRLIAGFIRPDEGRLTVDGRAIDGLPPHRRDIGIVFQDYALFPHLNVRDNIAFGPRMQGWRPADTRRRVRELLELVAMSGYERRKVTEISGGEQQRVALARALAPNPRLLLLDEPLSALDARLRQDLRGEIRRIQQELGLTTIYVTHDQEEALAIADRLAVMRAGKIEQLDTPEEVYTHPGSLFVASFVGQSNLLSGEMAGAQAELVRVRTSLGLLRGRRVGAQSPAAGKVILLFRPESCSLGGRPGARVRGNRLRGRVRGREYQGSFLRLEIEAGGHTLSVQLSPDGAPGPGEPVELFVDPKACLVFPAVP